MQIQVETLGSVAVSVDGRPAASLLTKPVRSAVLLYVVLESNPTRDGLIEMFWSDRDVERARRACTQTLYQLRQDLGGEWVVAAGNRLDVRAEVSTDLARFERAVEEGRRSEALALYRGPFLRDLGSLGGVAFEHWAERIRARAERLHRKARKAAIAAALDAGDLGDALLHTRAWVEIDPLDDEANHHRIELLARSGAREDALRCWTLYSERVRRELDVEPLEETELLVAAIRDGTFEVPAPDVPALGVVEHPGTTAVADDAAPAQAQRRRGSTGRAGMVAAAIVVLALIVVRPWSQPQSSAVATPMRLDPSIFAILPFELWSRDPDLAFLANAIRETVALELHGNDRLAVVSNPAVRRAHEDGADLDSIAQRFSAGSIITGAVRRADGMVIVDLGITDARRVDQYAPRRVQRPDSEIQHLEADVLGALSQYLGERLGRSIALARTLPPDLPREAYADYTEARHHYQEAMLVKGAPLGTRLRQLARADSLLVAAQRRAPRWTGPVLLRGWVARATARATGTMDQARWTARMEQAAALADSVLAGHGEDAEALELRGTARMHLGVVQEDTAVLRAAELDLNLATEHNPRSASTWRALTFLKLRSGRIDEAQEVGARAIAEDPFDIEGATLMVNMATALRSAMRGEEAAVWCERLVREHPSDYRGPECLLANAAITDVPRLSADSAARLVRRSDALDPISAGSDPVYRPHYRQILFGTVLQRRNLPDSARSVVDRAVARANAQGIDRWADYDLAWFELQAGNRDRAGSLLQRYVEQNPLFSEYAHNDRRWPAGLVMDMETARNR